MTVPPWRLGPVSVALLVGSLVACGSDDGSSVASNSDTVGGTITVFAAASLSGAFETIGEAFEPANPGVTVPFSFAASSELVAQITEGAPADVFASADMSNMAKLPDADAGAGTPRVFATNSSEIIVAPGNPLGIDGV